MVGNVEKDGNCECGDTTKGFQTYTFMQDDVQRCFTVFHPLDRAGEVLPVVFSPQCYGKDKLIGNSMTSETAADNKAAARYGFARIGVSTPDGNWVFGSVLQVHSCRFKIKQFHCKVIYI